MERIELTRDCEAVQIPSGTPVTLEQGTEAFITQSLGGSYTLNVPAFGGLVRISGTDADAIGKDAATADPSVASAELDEQIWAALKTCYDPEIPVNIVDLGLIYDLHVDDAPGGAVVEVKMTLTAPGCGMGTVIAADAQQKIIALPGIADARVDIVWDPPWSPQMITPAGKERLGMA